MSDISFTEKAKYGDLNAEQYELLLFRGELVEGGRPATVEFVLPLIDKRLHEIRSEQACLGFSSPDPADYADAVRGSEEELAEIVEQLKKDPADRT